METTAVKKQRKKQPSAAEKKALEQDAAITYNEYKMFEGKQYTGMKIGRGHKWYYDQGIWKEKKVTPDKWEFNYAVAKRRAGKAPEGSGVPVGTEYHWYIMAHQNVRKLSANDYSTSMTGVKFKIAHKRVDKDKWSTSAQGQKKRLIKFLKEMLEVIENTNPEEPVRNNGKEPAKRKQQEPVRKKEPLGKKEPARMKKEEMEVF